MNKINRIIKYFESRSDARTLEKSEEYVSSDKIVDRIIIENTLFAKLIGNYGDYQVFLDFENPEKSKCSCPAEMKICKHQIAVAFTYVRVPDSFFTFEKFLSELKLMEKAELITLITNVVKKKPKFLNLILKEI